LPFPSHVVALKSPVLAEKKPARTFGGHSLRSGLVTSAGRRGVNLMKICDQTGHKSLEMLRVYSRDAELFAGNAAAGLL